MEKMPVVRKPRVPAAAPKVRLSDEVITLSQLRDILLDIRGRELAKIKNILQQYSEETRTVPTKITRNSDGLITKIEKLIDGRTLELTYTRNDANVITRVDRRLLDTKVNITE